MEAVPRLSPAVVICLVILIVVAINAGLILAVKRGGANRQIDILRRAVSAARNPWAEQEKEYNELRERVTQLESDEADQPSTDE